MQKTPQIAMLLRELFSEIGDFQYKILDGPEGDIEIESPQGTRFLFETKSVSRVTPQTAESLFRSFRDQSSENASLLLLYAPVISTRTAKIAKEYGVSHIDYAGNCRIVDPQQGLLIHRTGIPNDYGKTSEYYLNVFSPKSSRVVRLMLEDPTRRWQVGALTDHPDVRVSQGLVSRIKKSLLKNGYATTDDEGLYLIRPRDLLRDWVKRYREEKLEEQSFYVRGDTPEVEAKVAQWCADTNIEYALARFSAAWRLAPEVRYSVATVFVSPEAFRSDSIKLLHHEIGARPVDSGANLVLCTPPDESCFAGRVATPLQTTSPLQTYLDLNAMVGRGEEAAQAIYDKYLQDSLEPSSPTANG